MAFSFETSGNNTFLVYTVQENDTLDTLTLGMITNNKIPGLLSVLYTRRNLEQFLKYNVTAKVTVRQFFSGVVNKRRLLGIFSGITEALAIAEEYMIDPASLMLDIDYIYADVSSCKAEIICLPILNAEGRTDVNLFFKNIMFTTQFDQGENCDYVARIINYLNSSNVFSVDVFKRLLEELQGTREAPKAAVAPEPRPAVQQPQLVIPQPTESPVVQTQVQKSVPQPEKSGGGTAAGGAVPGQSSIQGGFAVPGQSSSQGGFAVPGQSVTVPDQKPIKEPNVSAGQKDMSIFYLLQHYNKENAALFKAQKEAKKVNGKTAAEKSSVASSGFAVPGQQPVQPQQVQPQPQQVQPRPQPVQARPQQMQPLPQPEQSQPQQMQPLPQSVQPQFQSVARGENFGDTVIMGEDGYGEDTVVIDEVQMATVLKPYLLRISNNERIPLEKAVFHIGKERSYVDYCITGNATISRSHADIITKNGQCYIMDINSTNHTYVNEEMIPSNTEIPLAHGTKVRLSNEEFEFRTF